jgi:4-phospho-D-threonate 3-dehydrogenase / 4-phospho-D-erythronate 3-dehydrogenase
MLGVQEGTLRHDDDRPWIGLTMGDPAGVGPELTLRALADAELRAQIRLAVFGDLGILKKCAASACLPNPQFDLVIPAGELATCSFPSPADAVLVDHTGLLDLENFKPARVSAECGMASFRYIQHAIDAALSGRLAAVTTGPINKEATHAAGILYPGHTEMFAERAADGPWCMMQYSPEVTCTFVTVHVGYAEVPALISEQAVRETIELTAAALQRLHGRAPHLAVCGLNPHAGENGLFGNREEQRSIIPAIEAARKQGISLEGPLPPDTAFLPAKRRQVDAIVCMYHDQGHIPLKALAFESAVNTTLGLRVIRTSVDHGTAFDIAWRGEAMPDSLYAALRLARRMARERRCQA